MCVIDDFVIDVTNGERLSCELIWKTWFHQVVSFWIKYILVKEFMVLMIWIVYNKIWKIIVDGRDK